ncbi:hypothetical protein LCGC14_2743780 [marine sediment metagenome]|uniref:HNH nuclease domain-containing protein n=1 Tax=marine sediment metagenome TaxID=412755 RepID=A0A0F8Z3V5_9ZZZZ
MTDKTRVKRDGLWKDKQWLRNEYVNEAKDAVQISNKVNCSSTTIYHWLNKFNIPRRDTRFNLSNVGIGKNNPNWKGGRRLRTDGYILLSRRDHPRAYGGGTVLEHIVIMEKHLGRYLKYYGKRHPKNEVVHHIDDNKKNNKIENLYITTIGGNRVIHKQMESITAELYKKGFVGFNNKKGEYYIKDEKI